MSNQTLNQLVNKLKAILSDKRYFLVLDDMWIDDINTWTNLLSLFAVGRAGTVILITTRKENVACVTQSVKPYTLDRLPDSVCWSIFEKVAFVAGDAPRYPNLVKIGRSIVVQCGGIPLVVRCLASLFRGKRDQREWLQIQNMTSKHGEQYVHVMQVLKLSYDKLPSHLKPCFAYCSLFPKDWNYSIVEQTYMWSALGLLDRNDEIENCASIYWSDLISRSLYQELKPFFNGSTLMCTIHDLLHDLAINILDEELAVISLDKLEVSESFMHILWGYEKYDSLLSAKEFPEQLLKAKKARTFRFLYEMGRISLSFIKGIISSYTCLHILDLSGGDFEELPSSIGNLRHLRYLDLQHNPLLKAPPNTISKLLNLEI